MLFAIVRHFPVWKSVTGIDNFEVGVNTGPIIPGLDAPGARTLLALILVAYAVQYAWILVAAPVLSARRDGDLTSWFLFGTGIAGWWAMMSCGGVFSATQRAAFTSAELIVRDGSAA